MAEKSVKNNGHKIPLADIGPVIVMNLADVKLNPNNARIHDSSNLRGIGESLKAFGQVESLLIQKGTNLLIAGHGRLAKLQEIGATTAEVRELDISDADLDRLAIALNRTAETASWDYDKVTSVVTVAREAKQGIPGYTDSELDRLFESVKAEQTVMSGGDSTLDLTMFNQEDLEELKNQSSATAELQDQLDDVEDSTPVSLKATCPKCQHEFITTEVPMPENPTNE